VGAPASILLLAGVALGGRASLFGPVLGALAVGYGRSTLSENFPTQWTYFLGALFIVVILVLPGGVASLWPKLRARWPSSAPGQHPSVELDPDLDPDLDQAQSAALA
jgi:urea transport system permease protein